MDNRPPFCIFEKCKPIIVSGGSAKNQLQEGNSCFCMGENEINETWKAMETEHINDICFCIFTPFKGWSRFVMNNDDFEIIGEMIKGFTKRTERKIKLYGAS